MLDPQRIAELNQECADDEAHELADELEPIDEWADQYGSAEKEWRQ
ncbi:hypothetical protein [Brevibacterium moorei]|nr:hypothetical protein [Brevibacterium sp. 68QC2CO]MCQ9385143.1 hypothetical protein [Brevibacterium sp. 68QC2CO]